MVLVFQILQFLLGGILIFLILIHSPKSMGLGAYDGLSQIFSSQKTAESSLNNITYIIAGLFIFVSFLIGVGIIK